MEGMVKTGRWSEYGLAGSTAHVKKAKGDLKVKLVLSASLWNAEFTVHEDLKDIEVGENSPCPRHPVNSEWNYRYQR